MWVPMALLIGNGIANRSDHLGSANNPIGYSRVDPVLEPNTSPIQTQMWKVKP
jgi:hypothetical protein